MAEKLVARHVRLVLPKDEDPVIVGRLEVKREREGNLAADDPINCSSLLV